MALYNITLSGCDDSQTVTTDLTPEQFEAVQRIAALTALAHEECSCTPNLTVTLKHTEVTE